MWSTNVVELSHILVFGVLFCIFLWWETILFKQLLHESTLFTFKLSLKNQNMYYAVKTWHFQFKFPTSPK